MNMISAVPVQSFETIGQASCDNNAKVGEKRMLLCYSCPVDSMPGACMLPQLCLCLSMPIRVGCFGAWVAMH